MISPFQEELLTNQGDCPLHYHVTDRTPTHDTVSGIQASTNQVTPTGSTYAVTDKDDHILCYQTMTVTLPRSRGGREYEVTFLGTSGMVTVVPTGTDTILGYASVYLSVYGTSLRFKSIAGGWIII